MFKGAMFILLLGFAFVFGIYYLGGYSSWDPAEKCREAMDAIQPGMSWEEVIEGAGEPGKYQIIVKDEKEMFGETVVEYRPGMKRDFDYGLVASDINGGDVPNGFLFLYRYSQDEAFQVWFNSEFKVDRLEKDRFMDTIFQRDNG